MSCWAISCGVLPRCTTNTAIDEPSDSKANAPSGVPVEVTRCVATPTTSYPGRWMRAIDIGQYPIPSPRSGTRAPWSAGSTACAQPSPSTSIELRTNRWPWNPFAAQRVAEDPQPPAVLEQHVRADVGALERGPAAHGPREVVQLLHVGDLRGGHALRPRGALDPQRRDHARSRGASAVAATRATASGSATASTRRRHGTRSTRCATAPPDARAVLRCVAEASASTASESAMKPTSTSTGRSAPVRPNQNTDAFSAWLAPCSVHGAICHHTPGSSRGSRPRPGALPGTGTACWPVPPRPGRTAPPGRRRSRRRRTS